MMAKSLYLPSLGLVLFSILCCAGARVLNDATEVILLSEGGSELVKDASSAANPVAYGVDEVALGHIMDKIPAMFNQTLRPSIIQNETESSRIAFGTSASKNLIPFAVYLEIKENGPGYVTCGGSLITPHVVVTAAHCLFSDTGKPAARSVNIFTGSNDLYYSRVYKGYSYVKPSAYAPAINDKLDGDIALIYIKSAVTGIKPVALDGGRYAKQGRWYITAGWGKTQSGKDSDVLKWVAVPKVTTSQFQQVRQQLYASTGTGMPPIETDHMAAGLGSNGGDSCVGDSGGPLFTPGPSFTNSEANQNVLVGIVSYGPSAKCGGSLNLGVYTKVSYWKQWIKNTIAENNWTK